MKPTYFVQYWNAGTWNTADKFLCGSTKQTWDAASNAAESKEKGLIKQGYLTRIVWGA